MSEVQSVCWWFSTSAECGRIVKNGWGPWKGFDKSLVEAVRYVLQHQRKVAEQNLKALKARNEHRLCIDSANAAIRKFFVDDLPELINVSLPRCHL